MAPPCPIMPAFQLLTTCCEPGPLYWNMMTGYFFDGLKPRGFIIHPSSVTPSDVVNENVSLGVHPYCSVRALSFLLSSGVESTFPEAS